jgi:CheY-like chemotaxis protein
MTKVLLVEDDNNLREIFDMRLQAEGYKTVTAGDGEEALVIAVKEKPDLVIADVMMPKLSGFEMVENMRAAPELANVKVIMMTALGQAEDRARGEKLGVVKYLVKSQVTLEDFVRVVKEVMSPDGTSGTQASTTPDPATQQDNINNQQESEAPMPPQDNQTPANPPADAGANPAPMPDAGAAPAADPAAAPAAPAPDAGAQQTTAEETSAVQDQINNFESDPAAGAAPAADPAADASAAPAADASAAPAAAPNPISDAPAMPAADPNAPAAGQAPEGEQPTAPTNGAL